MYLIFDTETTGMIEDRTAPVTDFEKFPRCVQLAWQLHDEWGELIEVKNYIIRPDGFTIPFNAEKVHGISTDRAMATGVPLAEVLDVFRESLSKTKYLVGHNLEFDLMIMGAEYARANRNDGLQDLPWLDTMVLSTDHCQLKGGRGKGYKFPTLAELSQKLFEETVDNAHNASADVEATARCFLELLRIGVIHHDHVKTEREYFARFKERNPSPFKLIGLNIEPYQAAEEKAWKKVASNDEGPGKAELKENEKLLATQPFVHLHNHTQYSILQSTSEIKSLVRKARELEMPAVAITDLGNMFGVFNFVKECAVNGIKSIVGCEFFVAEDRKVQKFTKDNPDRRFRQVLIAKNRSGYNNLSKLCSAGFVEGYYAGFPRVDREIILQYKENLIATTGGLEGEVPGLILNVGESQAEEAFKWWLEHFRDDFYVQLQRHGLEEENRVNEVLLRFCEKYNVKYYAANEVYYQDKEDANAHDILLCVKEGELQSTPIGRGRGFRPGMPNQEYYFKTQDEMKALFRDLPQAIFTLSEIVDKVEPFALERDILLPKFDLPEGFEDQNDYLRHLTFEGAKKRYPEITDEVRDRLELELKVIRDMGFPGYFLIVQDFTSKAREMGVSVGPGRGSAAGSAVAFCTGITNIDPIKYKLLFERFLNPERVSMPDIDIDFDDEGRDKIIDYVVKKYGHNQVAQIITYGTMAAKSSIRDVARVMDLPLSEADRLAKLVPDLTSFGKFFGKNDKELGEKFNGDSLQQVKELISIAQGTDESAKIVNQARKLEGSVRNTGIHACGVIITPDDITNHIPVATSKDAELLVTQFDNKVVEDAGLLKMDFLGLKTLTIIKDAIAIIKQRHGTDIDPDEIPLDDEKTFELYQRGETNGTFQFESTGMQKYLKELKPTNIEDLIAMNALYRPGPMQYIETFIKRKKGEEPVEYPHELLEPILKDTYGIMVYQEQIMQTAQILGGYSLGGADLLRRAMGKKKMDVMQQQREVFREGASRTHGIAPEKADEVFDIMMKFAEYGFNRSHSAAYSVVAFQTAYLKANYPAEYMASVLTNNMGDIKKVTFFMEECRRAGIPVLGPDINESRLKFTVNTKGEVRFGLGAIKGLGEAAVESIVEERGQNGAYTSIFDLTRRVDSRSAGKKSMEVLALAGAFDSLGNAHRAQYFAADEKGSTLLEKAVRYGNSYQAAMESSQVSLFGEHTEVELPEPEIPEAEPWRTLESLNREKEVVGVYISGHPLDDYRFEISNFTTATTAALADLEKVRGRELRIAGIITDAAHLVGKTGTPYGRFTLEDYDGSHTFMVFKDDYIRLKPYLNADWFVLCTVQVKPWFNRRENREILDAKIQSMDLLPNIREKMTKKIMIDIRLQAVDENLVGALKSLCGKHVGKTPLQVNVWDDGTSAELTSRSIRISPDNAFMEELEKMEDVRLRIET